MIKKLYVLRNGKHPRIYENWLDFYKEIKDMEYVESTTFSYEDEDEYDRDFAMKSARIYLGIEEAEYEDELSAVFPEFDEIEDTDATETKDSTVDEEQKKDEEMHDFFGIPKAYGNAWVDLILELSASNYNNGMGYSERYYPVKVYFFIVKLVVDLDKLIDKYIRPVDLSKNGNSKDEFWHSTVKFELEHSKDYIELKNHISSKLNMTDFDLEDLERRIASLVTKRNESLFSADVSASICLREFLNKGNVTLVSLYKELVNNEAYRTELEKVSAIYNNPDLELKRIQDDRDKSIQQIVHETDSIRLKLKSHVVGQDDAITKLETAYFNNEKDAGIKKGPRSVFLFAGPPGVGKTYTAELLSSILDIPYKRFDMSAYAHHESVDELEGISTFWKSSKPGVLTSFVDTHPECVLLFDEIEKAHPNVIKLFLQIIDEGFCLDRFYDKNISFKKCTLIFTTNAGRKLYEDAEKENLTLINDRIVVDALEKDVIPGTTQNSFPPELVSRFSSNTIIMFNHLNSGAIRRVILSNIDSYMRDTSKRFGIDIKSGKYAIAATTQFSIGGSKDARNASKIAGKLISKEIYELLMLIEEKTNREGKDLLKSVSFDCDYTGVDEKIVEYYTGEQSCTVAVFSDRDVYSKLFGANNVNVKTTSDYIEYQSILKSDKVLFAIIDYTLGNRDDSKTLNILDIKSDGKDVFKYTKNNYRDLPIYILMDDSKPFSPREKIYITEMGVDGIIGTDRLFEEIESCYFDICCNNAVDTLNSTHQIITYKTRKEYDAVSREGKIVFYGMKYETAIEAEDRGTVLSSNGSLNLTWDDIYVSRDIKDELQFFIDYLKNPEAYMRRGVKVPMGALMLGPRGTGKTSLAKVVASMSQLSFLSTTGAELTGMSPEDIHELFRKARKYAPCVLFIDEIDAVGFDRGRYGINPRLNTILTEMDGFNTNKNSIVFVMAATNLGKELDPALVRRFDRSFLVSLPKAEGRAWMIRRLISKNKASYDVSEKEIENLIIRSEGMSLSDIEQMMDLALRVSIRNNKLVDDAIIDEALELSRYGEIREDISETDIKHTAYHEAGHAIINLHNGNKPSYISIVARGDFGGYVSPERMGNHPTKERLLNQISTMLGGRAAEMELGFGLTPGASHDLASATLLAKRMVCDFGMYEEEIGLATISDEEYPTNEKAKVLVNKILSEQLREARKIINEDRDAIDRLVTALLESKNKYLTRPDIYKIYTGGN